MWRIKRSIQAILTALLLGCLTIVQLNPIRTDAADVPSLIISELKITSGNGQFITLYNATGTALDASKYQLQYFNNFDLSKATSSKLIALSGTIPPHGYMTVSDGTIQLCYRLAVDSASLGLSSTAGMVEVLAFSQAGHGASVYPLLEDYASWSKSPSSGAQTLPANMDAYLLRQPVDAARRPIVSIPGAGSWLTVQPDATDPCRIVAGSPSDNGALQEPGQLLLPSDPPATIFPDASMAPNMAVPIMPAADLGLMSPVISELLPNPGGSGTDATDEFIELYNPNAQAFDLSGFVLQSGLTTAHTFPFPAGTILQPHGFRAFYSKATKLSMSNTAGKVLLLDPFGKPISTSETYASAKDGTAWALAKGKWYWTTSPTPGKENTIHQPVAGKTIAKTTAKKVRATTVTASGVHKATVPTGAASGSDGPEATPIHLRTLALVVGAALLYGAYEYRADVANRIHQFKRYLGDRHADRT